MESNEQDLPYAAMIDTESLAMSLRNRLQRGMFFSATLPEARALDAALQRFLAAHQDEETRQSYDLSTSIFEAL